MLLLHTISFSIARVLTVHGNDLHLLWAKAFPIPHLFILTPDITGLGNLFNDFIFDAVIGRNWNLLSTRQRCMHIS